VLGNSKNASCGQNELNVLEQKHSNKIEGAQLMCCTYKRRDSGNKRRTFEERGVIIL
jgi:hypothetical protein